MPRHAPFEFERRENLLVDTANGLAIDFYSWPEYHYTVCLQPLSGPQAEAWPVDQRAYFQFSYRW
ncbi:hypothetical protein [Sphingomicrobium nitratireducens]|uniref:hypothetical protein n=1 Tax=Sphingomicrobium nitratireducens TaxID=2964666 RepID=UPI00223ED42F|nr:hypothetical protein [Sphingomicrobium nitratireducens]